MKDVIRVGFPVPLTGVYGVEAQDQVNGAQLAIEEFNETGGYDGRYAELLVRDTKFDINLARESTEELITKEDVAFVVGALKSEDLVAISDVCAKYGKIFNGICGSDNVLTKQHRSPFTFHEGMSFHMIGDSLGRYIFSHLGSRVAMLTVDMDLGRHFERALLHVGKQIKVDFVKRLYHKQNESDLREHLLKIMESKPDVVVFNNLGHDQATAIRQSVEMGIPDKMRVAVAFFSIAQMLEAGPEMYEGVIGSATYYWKLEDRFQSARRFNDRYRRKFHGSVGGSYAAFGYNGVRSVLEAARRAESLESTKLQDSLLDMRFDWCKGPQYYRRLDHQSCQSVVIMETKGRDEIEHDQDWFHIIDVIQFLRERSFHVSREVT